MAGIEKNMIFWRKIVIFHTKYPNNFRAPLRSAQFFEVRPLHLIDVWVLMLGRICKNGTLRTTLKE
jgi:hypothetical protein